VGSAIGDLLPAALVIAVGPIQIIAVILLLFSPRAISNSLAFLLGWVAGLAIVSAIALIVEGPAGGSSNGKETVVGGILRLVLGVGLVFLAYRQWQKRLAVGEKAELPRWMTSIETIGPAKALGLGVLLSGLNIKIILLTLAAMLAVTEASLSGAQTLAAATIFIVVASISVAAPVLLNLILGQRAAGPLTASRAWLEANNATIMVVLLLVIGVVVAGKGLVTLIS
jgi:Sap, sulfolipid-1-addressing protein